MKNEKFIKQICNQIETAVNRSIKGFPDAVWLSDLFTLKKMPISASTIARLYGLTNSSQKPYLSTLDNLAKFLDYDNWVNYVEDQSKHYFNSNIFLTEETEGFSQSVLELALSLKRYDTVKMLLGKYPYFDNNPIHFSTANLIGKYVKKNNYDEDLLLVLANSKAGQSLFYECFVDDNNENNYFSNTLFTYYLPQVTNKHDIYFVYSYLLAQNIYSENWKKSFVKEYQELSKSINIKQLHYHLLSRYFECNILIDGMQGNLQKNVDDYLNTITNYALSIDKNEWLLARSIRALLHFGFKKELLNHLKFNEIINATIMKKRKSKNSGALYIIQLYWLYGNIENRLTYQPFHFSADYLQGNSVERIAIETATASLYSKGVIKKAIKENLKQYCANTKIKWIINLLYN
ncbi:hypothetical protein [Flavobacterium sp.]|uniref:hypothetical protein n=1 Tax=Flavobacterium sp. TaxID=239 RepID=UPI002487C922|nr:hypothetical protein [Flavobacterium sp.]MDI1317755.1 hypothetical protein [Flavobacterium sp.]